MHAAVPVMQHCFVCHQQDDKFPRSQDIVLTNANRLSVAAPVQHCHMLVSHCLAPSDYGVNRSKLPLLHHLIQLP